LLVPLGLVFGGRLSDPRARRGDRGSGFARARKQPQAVIVGGVSLEAAPPARQDDTDTTSIKLGVALDDAKAREWYEKAAYEGDASAMNSLGALYYNGQGVARDFAKAREWYQKAADKGDAIAMTSLGWLYQNGQGVAQDYAKAREWYESSRRWRPIWLPAA